MKAAIFAFFRRLFGYAPNIDPPKYACANVGEARWRANLALELQPNRTVWEVAPTGSMAPLIPKAHCYIVTEAIPFEAIRPGIVATYRAAWNPGAPVTHRLVAKDALGYIASGDANARSESFERVTRANFIGEVVGIWTYPQSL